MGLIITWQDVSARYPELDKLPNGTSPEVQDNLIQYAEGAIHGRLASGFATPFTTDNITAKDLCVDMLYVQVMLSRQPEKAKTISEAIDARVSALLSGSSSMVTALGAIAVTSTGDAVWSSSANYSPVFGLGAIEDAAVSSQQLLDEAATRE